MKFTYETAEAGLLGQRIVLEDEIERLTEQKRIVEASLEKLRAMRDDPEFRLDSCELADGMNHDPVKAQVLAAFKKRDHVKFDLLLNELRSERRARR